MNFFLNKKFLTKLILSILICLLFLNTFHLSIVQGFTEEDFMKQHNITEDRLNELIKKYGKFHFSMDKDNNVTVLFGNDYEVNSEGQIVNNKGEVVGKVATDESGHNQEKHVIDRIEGDTIYYKDGCTENRFSGQVDDDNGTKIDDNSLAAHEAEEDAESTILKTGGKLLQPIVELIMAIGDGAMSIIHSAIMGSTDAFVIIDKSANVVHIVLGVLITLAVVALTGGIAYFASQAIIALGGNILAASIISAGFKIGTLAVVVAGVLGYSTAVGLANEALFPEVTSLPMFSISPEEIFRGDILLFDVNIFNPKEVKHHEEAGNDYYYYIDKNGEEVRTSKQNTVSDLKTVVARWYYTLRNLALVAMMIILIYVGIKILLTSVATDKAKYKQMLFDWLVGICLIFVMHYIMIFAIELTEATTDLIKSATKTKYFYIIGNVSDKHMKKYKEAFEAYELDSSEFIDEGNKTVSWPTNLIGMERINAQVMNGSPTYVGHALCYVVLVLFTIFFAFTYGKRLLYIVFLTVISPLIAITYPLDKMSDGKAQGFDTWLKEYIFNLILQPIHLLLYTVLISMAFDLAGENVIYSIIAIGFMMPAEKLLRQFFNFQKAHTPGFLGGATGAAMVMSGLSAISKMGGSKSKGKNDDGGANANSNRIRENRGFDSSNNFDNVMNGVGLDSGDDLKDDANEDDNKDLLKDQELDDINARMQEIEDEEGFAGNLYANDEWKDLYNRREELMKPSEENNTEIGENEEEGDGTELLDENQNNEGEAIDASEGEDIQTGSRAKSFLKATAATIPGFIGKGVRVTAGLTGAGIGMAAGIASGNLGDTVKYTTAGAYAGQGIGKAVTNIPSNLAGTSSGIVQQGNKIREAYEKDYYGTDYGKHKREELDEQFKKDSDTRKKYAQELGIDQKYNKNIASIRNNKNISTQERKEQIKKLKEQRNVELNKIMNDAVEYRKFNVTDDDVIIKAMKMDGGNAKNRASRDKIASAMIASSAQNSKDVGEYVKRLQKQGVSEKKAEQIAANARKINKKI